MSIVLFELVLFSSVSRIISWLIFFWFVKHFIISWCFAVFAGGHIIPFTQLVKHLTLALYLRNSSWCRPQRWWFILWLNTNWSFDRRCWNQVLSLMYIRPWCERYLLPFLNIWNLWDISVNAHSLFGHLWKSTFWRL